MDINNLKRDTARIEGGEWIGDIPGMGDLRLRVRGTTSATFQARVARLSRAAPKGDRERDNSLKPAALSRIMGQAAAEDLLFDWANLRDGDSDVPYSKDLATKWLTEPDYRGFFEAVLYAAGIVDNGRTEVEEAFAGN